MIITVNRSYLSRSVDYRCVYCGVKFVIDDRIISKRTNKGLKVHYCLECAERLNII